MLKAVRMKKKYFEYIHTYQLSLKKPLLLLMIDICIEKLNYGEFVVY